MSSILKYIAGALLGAGCGAAAIVLAQWLLKRRDKEYKAGKTAWLIYVIAGAVVGALIAGLTVHGPVTVMIFLLLIIAETVSITDVQSRVIPNDCLLAILALTLAFGIPTLCGLEGWHQFKIGSSFAGMGVCLAVFILPGLFGKKVGAGDAKLAAVTGFCLGLMNSLVVIVIMGVEILLFALLQRRAPMIKFFQSMIPMGPFIAIGMMAVSVLMYM